MKNLKVILTLFLSASLLFISCDDNDDTFIPEENSNTTINYDFGTTVSRDFIGQIIDENEEPKNETIQKITKPIYAEGAWIQFLFLLKFWLDDTSKGFEKTDIMIEKSVKAVLDVLDTTPLESVIDLGKFIWKERFN